MSIAFYGIFGVLFIAFCVFTYMNTKTWRATHVIFLFLVFLMSFAFLALASMSLKTRSVHMAQAEDLQAQLEQAQAQGEVLAHGAEDGSTVGAFEAREKLGRAILDRGRVWRGCQPQEGQQNAGMVQAIRISTVSPEQAAAGGNPPPHRINAKAVLHAFREAPTPEGRVPQVYLGEFTVAEDAPDSTELTLVPTLPLSIAQNPAINFNPGDGTTWALYEQMPVDAHEFFGELSEEEIRALLPNAHNLPPERWEQVVSEFLRDGKRAEQGDLPANVWSRLKFTKAYTIDVDSEAAQALLESTYFDNTGRAIADRLRAGEPATVKAGTVLTVDGDTANQLVNDGVAERDAEQPYVYLRPLVDYEFAFHNIYTRSVNLDDTIRVEQRDIATINDANQKTEERIAARQTEQTNLQEDNQYLRNEIAELDKLHAAMQQQWTDLRAELSRLYQTNLLLAQEIARLDQETSEAIERRTAEALSGAE